MRPQHQKAEEAQHQHSNGGHGRETRQAYAIDELGKIVHAALVSGVAKATQGAWQPMGKNYLVDGKHCLNYRLLFAKWRQKVPGEMKERLAQC